MITEQDAWKIIKAFTNEIEDGSYISPLVYVLDELMKMQDDRYIIVKGTGEKAKYEG